MPIYAHVCVYIYICIYICICMYIISECVYTHAKENILILLNKYVIPRLL